MAYEIYNEDLDSFVTQEYFYRINSNNRNFTHKDGIINKCGRFRLKELYFKDLYVSNCQYSFYKTVKMQAKINKEMIFLSFMNKGVSYFNCKSINNCLLKQNSCNLFYLAGGEYYTSVLEKGGQNEIMDIVISKSYLYSIINKHPELFERLYKKIQSRDTFVLFDKGFFISPEIFQILHQLKETELLGNGESLYAEAKVMELLSLMLGKHNKRKEERIPLKIKEKMYEARFIIESNYLLPPGIHELALQIGISDTALKYYFKKVFNTTVFGYLFEYRMGKARKLLFNNELMNISEIAEQSGYEYPSHFCTAFKRKFGLTAKEFREKHRAFPDS